MKQLITSKDKKISRPCADLIQKTGFIVILNREKSLERLFVKNCDYNVLLLSTTLPWSNLQNGQGHSGQDSAGSNVQPSFSLHKTRSSPSIFAMSAKSVNIALDFNNPSASSSEFYHSHDLFDAKESYLGNNNDESHYPVAHSNYPPDKHPEEENKPPVLSPNSLRRSLTLEYDCDWNKSSTLPHDSTRSALRNHHLNNASNFPLGIKNHSKLKGN